MRKKPDERVLKEIDKLFELARKEASQQPALAKKSVAKARKLAKRNNLSIKPYRKFFCKKCSSYFTAQNSQIRISKGIKSIKCLRCGAYRRFRIKA